MLHLVESHSLFHAQCVKPGIKFENQEDEEVVLLSLRAHPITLLPVFINSIAIFILIFFLGFILGQFLSIIQLIYTISFFFFGNFIYFWLQIINWYFNMGIVTNKQIIDADFNALTFRNISRTELSKVEDISVKVSGFASSILDLGNVFIQTAGTEINTEFMNIPHPARAAHIIQDIVKEYGNNK